MHKALSGRPKKTVHEFENTANRLRQDGRQGRNSGTPIVNKKMEVNPIENK